MQFIKKKLLISGLISLSAILHAPISSATAITLGSAANYNLFVLQNFTSSSSDSQGALAVGGNASLSAYTVATLGGVNPSMVVGGNLSQTGGNINGNVKVGGSYSKNSSAGVNGTVQSNLGTAGIPIDFASTFSLLTSLSTTLSGQGVNAVNDGGKMLLTGNGGSGQQIFKATESIFENSWGYFANNMTKTQEIIVNVAGTTIDVDGDTLMKANNYSWIGNQGHVLYNFYEATTINIKGSLYGSILAPNANILAFSGMVNGQVIARSWADANSGAGGSQLNTPLFMHNQALPPPSVPVPASIWLFLSGVTSLAALARRRSMY